MARDLSETIAKVAEGPAAAQNAAGESATQQKLTDLIEADRHLAAKAAAGNPFAALRSLPTLPPGCG